MTVRTPTFILLVALAVGYSPNLWASTDDTDTVDANANWEFEIDDRGDNALGIEVDDENINKLSALDCEANVSVDFKVTLLGTAVDSGKTAYLYAGEDCDEDATITCEKIAENDALIDTFHFDNINFEDMFPGVDCEDGPSETVNLWLALLDTEGEFNSTVDDGDIMGVAITMRLDLDAPSSTVDVTGISLGDRSITVTWDALEDINVDGYAAFYVEAGNDDCSGTSLTEGAAPDPDGIEDVVTSYSNPDATSIRVSGLSNSSTYAVAIATLDDAGNPSVLSNIMCETPSDTVGFDPVTDGKYCFIATAAFGSYDHPTVRVLREFRDRFLAKSPGGDALISAYYSVGPSLARFVIGSEELRENVVAALSLFSGFTRALVALGPMAFLTGILLCLLAGLCLGLAIPAPRRYR